ncbi:MAG TPA: tripartite tricarboxylate transporter TctB family protein [Burkholderiales bacterium]|nr:tripartite tricarboxylate transporter TctB family protein [Burkholderiales bacterium]
MKVNLGENRDFLAGLLMIIIGAVAFYMALDYPFGSALRMGPGYFPRVLAGMFIAFGIFVGLRGLRIKEKVEGIWGWKALALITAAFVAYGWLMDRIGMIPSLVVLFFVSALAGHEFRLKEVIILTVVMTAFAWAVFIWGLGMPYRLFWWD